MALIEFVLWFKNPAWIIRLKRLSIRCQTNLLYIVNCLPSLSVYIFLRFPLITVSSPWSVLMRYQLIVFLDDFLNMPCGLKELETLTRFFHLMQILWQFQSFSVDSPFCNVSHRLRRLQLNLLSKNENLISLAVVKYTLAALKILATVINSKLS